MLRAQMDPDTFTIWFEPLQLLGEYEGTLLLTGPRRTVRWVARRYSEVLGAAVVAVSDFKSIDFVVPLKAAA